MIHTWVIWLQRPYASCLHHTVIIMCPVFNELKGTLSCTLLAHFTYFITVDTFFFFDSRIWLYRHPLPLGSRCLFLCSRCICTLPETWQILDNCLGWLKNRCKCYTEHPLCWVENSLFISEVPQKAFGNWISSPAWCWAGLVCKV